MNCGLRRTSSSKIAGVRIPQCMCDKRPISALEYKVLDEWIEEDGYEYIAELTRRDLQHLKSVMKRRRR